MYCIFCIRIPYWACERVCVLRIPYPYSMPPPPMSVATHTHRPVSRPELYVGRQTGVERGGGFPLPIASIVDSKKRKFVYTEKQMEDERAKRRRLEDEMERLKSRLILHPSGHAGGDDAAGGGCSTDTGGTGASTIDTSRVTLAFQGDAWRRKDGSLVAPRENTAGIQLVTRINGIEVDDEVLGKHVFQVDGPCTASYVLYLEKNDGKGNYIRIPNGTTSAPSAPLLQLPGPLQCNDFIGPLSRAQLRSLRWTNKTAKKAGPVRVCIGLYPQIPVLGQPSTRYELARKVGITHSPDLCLVSESKGKYGDIEDTTFTSEPSSPVAP